MKEFPVKSLQYSDKAKAFSYGRKNTRMAVYQQRKYKQMQAASAQNVAGAQRAGLVVGPGQHEGEGQRFALSRGAARAPRDAGLASVSSRRRRKSSGPLSDQGKTVAGALPSQMPAPRPATEAITALASRPRQPLTAPPEVAALLFSAVVAGAIGFSAAIAAVIS
jgi:hypothetical protein